MTRTDEGAGPRRATGWLLVVWAVTFILATAVPGFPVLDLAGFIGSTLWGVWVIALGVAVLRAPIRRPTAEPVAVTAPA